MNILEKLKTIFEGKFGDFFANNTLKFFDFSKNNTNVLELKDGQRLSIDLSKATDKEKALIKNDVIDVIVQDEEDFFSLNKSEEKTKNIKNNLPLEKDEELLRFYKEKLDIEMFKALEACIIVKNAYRNGQNILDLKRDIAWKYPSFGNNLCNLATRDYFQSYFKELYENMRLQDDFDITNYQKEVRKIVESLPYMVFINRYKSYEEYSGEVKFKLDKLRKYGTEKLKLHGLGKDNVQKALKIAEEYKNESSILIERDINQSETIITITFRFLNQ